MNAAAIPLHPDGARSEAIRRGPCEQGCDHRILTLNLPQQSVPNDVARLSSKLLSLQPAP